MQDPSGKRKARRRRNKSSLPSGFVWNASDLVDQPGAIEVAVLIAVAILVVYFFGFYESVMYLPESKVPDFRGHMGANLNLPHPDEWDREAAIFQEPDSVAQAVQNVLDHKEIIPPPPPAKPVSLEPPSPMKGELRELEFDGDDGIPAGKWPVSIRDETFEEINHPGDSATKMKVPKFWSKPIHDNILMTREQALKIGTCVEPDPITGSHNRGTDCPLDQRTIFVGIASYRDFECRSTAESIFLRAKNPHRIRIAVVDQIVDGEDPVCDAPLEPCETNPNQGLCLYKDQIDVYQMEAYLSVGPVFARHIGYRMYRGEYYATQSDAHVTYTQDWDADIINQLEITHNEMAVLSTYLSDVQGSIDAEGHSLRHTRPIMCNTYYEGGAQGQHLRHGSQPERVPSVHGTPQLQPWWAAGYSFSRGHFVVNVPYDWNSVMIFQVRAWSE